MPRSLKGGRIIPPIPTALCPSFNAPSGAAKRTRRPGFNSFDPDRRAPRNTEKNAVPYSSNEHCPLLGPGFDTVWPKLEKNSPDLEGLAAQFHRWFDGFKSLKLIHHLRDHGFPPMPVVEAISELLPTIGTGVDSTTELDRLSDLLDQLRAACRDWD